MSLSTREIITRAPGYWTEVPISDMVIGRVEALAKHQSQPLLQESNLIVKNSPDQEVDEDEFDADFVPQDEDSDGDESTDGWVPDDVDATSVLSDLNDLSHLMNSNATEQHGDTDEQTDGSDAPSGQSDESDSTGDDGATSEAVGEPEGAALTEADNGTPKPSEHDTVTVDETQPSQANAENTEGESSDTEEEHATTYNLRGNRARSYGYRFANAIDEPASKKSYYGQDKDRTTDTQLTQIRQQEQAQQRSGQPTPAREDHNWMGPHPDDRKGRNPTVRRRCPQRNASRSQTTRRQGSVRPRDATRPNARDTSPGTPLCEPN